MSNNRETYMGQHTAAEAQPGDIEFARLMEQTLSGRSDSPAEMMAKAELDVAIVTAKRFPRSVARALKQATDTACLSPDIAAGMFYKLPRAGSAIEGPSVRLAEVIGTAWGNLRYSGEIIEEGREFIVARGTCHDLESNVQCSTVVRRRITGKDGSRFNSDLIGVTGMAAVSIALRNAIFKVVPMAITNQVYVAAKSVATGGAASLAERRTKAVRFFVGKYGLEEARVLAAVGAEGIEDLSLKDVETLQGYRTALAEGEAEVDALFPELTDDDGEGAAPKSRGARIAKKVAKKKTARKEDAGELQKTPLLIDEFRKLMDADGVSGALLDQYVEAMTGKTSFDDLLADDVERMMKDMAAAKSNPGEHVAHVVNDWKRDQAEAGDEEPL